MIYILSYLSPFYQIYPLSSVHFYIELCCQFKFCNSYDFPYKLQSLCWSHCCKTFQYSMIRSILTFLPPLIPHCKAAVMSPESFIHEPQGFYSFKKQINVKFGNFVADVILRILTLTVKWFSCLSIQNKCYYHAKQ